jgi:UDP-glucose 4-epimerase
VRALVTGGAGFIGSHVVDALLARGDEVLVLDDLSTGSRDRLDPAAPFAAGDIRTDAPTAFAQLEPDVCVHLAAQADVTTSVARPSYDADVNVLGTIAVLEAARAHDAHVVFSSSGGAIYGECEQPADEDAARTPLSPYGIAKLAAEEYLLGWNRLHGTAHSALRFANVYGPRQAAGLEGGVVAIFLESMQAGEPTTIYGDGEQARDFVHVDDVVRAVLAALDERRPGVLNIGTGKATSVNKLYEACRLVTGVGAVPASASARPGEVRRSVIDPGRAKAALGWSASVSLEDGLAATWAWTRSGHPR